MSLFMEYDIAQMAAANSLGGTYTRDPFFDDSGAQIGLNLFDALNNVGFKGIDGLWLICIYLRLKTTPQEKVKSHDLGIQLTLPLREMTMPGIRSLKRGHKKLVIIDVSVIFEEVRTDLAPNSSILLIYVPNHPKMVLIAEDYQTYECSKTQ